MNIDFTTTMGTFLAFRANAREYNLQLPNCAEVAIIKSPVT